MGRKCARRWVQVFVTVLIFKRRRADLFHFPETRLKYLDTHHERVISIGFTGTNGCLVSISYIELSNVHACDVTGPIVSAPPFRLQIPCISISLGECSRFRPNIKDKRIEKRRALYQLIDSEAWFISKKLMRSSINPLFGISSTSSSSSTVSRAVVVWHATTRMSISGSSSARGKYP